jgi:hypothetical protein
MKDFAASEDPAVQAQLDRLAALSLPQGRLGLDVIRELLRRLGDPQKRLPPVFHVAGTDLRLSARDAGGRGVDGARRHQAAPGAL